MDAIMNLLDKYRTSMKESKFAKNKYISYAAEASGLNPADIVGIAYAFLLLWVFFGFGSSLLCNLIGFVYPAYASFKAIESEGKDDDTQWLTYWVVYSTFVIAEHFSGFILRWIPLYYPLKLIFLTCLFSERIRLAETIYSSFIAPILRSQEGVIDAALDKVQKRADVVMGDVKKGISEAAVEVVTKSVERSILDSKNKMGSNDAKNEAEKKID
mmetsp:Transcript_41999/g.108116  ORF Transcript_41999/g.108116 Transcript_41999/m.108116 type:complete len:214 (-) Transcript_41999:43-684(-)|eukprot:CAMPEP_0113889012 /NCGR_PEP_ID=MMETSP0780_2-20120614/13223_1 /TAXON_ID=652834 /ORGANISM="Palpitomonas bilix" /LENGTH=213 /DNA_ID=CAMNT_0000877989 /DNA_START=242 /DNA_END=883 /DNA_ORIENTATION=+ /assembly_acc=CAM_ASM_000599